MNAVDLARAMAVIERRHPRASVLYARIILALAVARNREMAQSDLSELLGRGRDHTGVQGAVARLVKLGILTRDLDEAERILLVRLADTAEWPLH